MADPDSFFDSIPFIGCINIYERKDRYKHISEQFWKHGFLNRVRFRRAHKSPRGGRYGCWESHTTLYREAIECGASYALIFEDDTVLYDDFKQRLFGIREFIKSEAWNYINLNHTIVITIKKKVTPNIYDGFVGNNRCYLIQNKAMKRITELPFPSTNLDKHIYSTFGTLHFSRPPLTYDACFSSDNDVWRSDEVEQRLMQQDRSIRLPIWLVNWVKYLIYRTQGYTHIFEYVITHLNLWKFEIVYYAKKLFSY